MAKKNTNRTTSSKEVVIIASNSVVPFQGVPLPYSMDWDDQVSAFEEALNGDYPIYLTPLINPKREVFKDNLCEFGVEMKVIKIVDLPDGNKNVFLLGAERYKVKPSFQRGESVFSGDVVESPDKLNKKDLTRFGMIMNLVRESYDYVKTYFSEMTKIQMAAPKELQDDLKTYLNFIIVTSPLDYEDRLKLLAKENLADRAEATLVGLEKIKQHIELRKEIFQKTSYEMDREQRDHFLRAQIRQIQSELGDDEDNDLSSLEERASKKLWNNETKEIFRKELRKLKRFNPSSPDYAIQYTYLDTILNLPWDNIVQEDINITKLEEDLEKDHYGLKKVKERIIEHIAVLKQRGDMRSPILCLYGPPGVGKTSLCKSIANSIGREYARISLGGLHDETQIRGHRRTYIGALPGRIITSLSKLDSNNPVFVLDEIDKIGNEHRGDPAEALLEVLDPEQNSRFHDNYLDMDYDLSKILFIATANQIGTISAPLLDRMELIEISGYLPEEKIEIARRHLVPKALENHGFRKNEISFSADAIKTMIESYTRESGVRKLDKTIAKVLRKIALKKAKGEKYPKRLNGKQVKELLGKEDIIQEVYENDLPIGVIVGLAWTSTGGEILYFESSLSHGKGNITITGNLGDVMKESATIAYQWVKANAERLGIDPELFAKTDVHIHVPEGAVPKDGPSAGITMVSSIVSAFTGRRGCEKTAMTGEATLRGKVLPIGGVKEKILAAKRAGIEKIILSEKNRRDVEEIEQAYKEGLRFIYVRDLTEVIENALV